MIVLTLKSVLHETYLSIAFSNMFLLYSCLVRQITFGNEKEKIRETITINNEMRGKG